VLALQVALRLLRVRYTNTLRLWRSHCRRKMVLRYMTARAIRIWLGRVMFHWLHTAREEKRRKEEAAAAARAQMDGITNGVLHRRFHKWRDEVGWGRVRLRRR
jgi:hypothetical protein